MDRHCLITHRTPARGDSRKTALLLPDRGPWNEDYAEPLRAAGHEGRIVCVMPPRSRYHGPISIERLWFHRSVEGDAERSTLEDSLWHVERLILELRESAIPEPEDLVLYGIGEGAEMLRHLAIFVGDQVGGMFVREGDDRPDQFRATDINGTRP